MFESFLITFREGLEAFLIVAITLAYLRKTNRSDLSRFVYMGIGVSLLVSAVAGYYFGLAANQSLIEGALAMVAGALVASMTVHMMRTAKTIRSDIHQRLEIHSSKNALEAAIGIFLFTVLMISREGMETAMMLGSLNGTMQSSSLILGAISGILVAGAIGILWVANSHLINIKRFLQVTGVFLVFFAVHLFFYGFHELTEANAIPFVDNNYWHIATEPFADESTLFAQMTSYGLVIIPVLWLGISIFLDRLKKQKQLTA